MTQTLIRKFFNPRVVAIGTMLVPTVALAQQVIGPSSQTGTGIGRILLTTCNLVLTLISMLFILAALYFLWGVFQFITKANDEKARSDAKGIMTYGIIGLVVMVAFQFIVTSILNTYGVTTQGAVFTTCSLQGII